MLLVRSILSLSALALVVYSGEAHAATIMYDDFSGRTMRLISGANRASFTADTAGFSSPHNGIEYSSSQFPAEGIVELKLRLDDLRQRYSGRQIKGPQSGHPAPAKSCVRSHARQVLQQQHRVLASHSAR
jgi:hypothetical protein